MVAYRDTMDKVDGGDYWHIPADLHDWKKSTLKEDLDLHGVPYKPSASKARLIELTRRFERGLLCYDSCSTQELVTFLRQRGISNSPKRPNRAAMIGTLEKMDEEAIFHKFNDLPPELRLRIYAAHYHWLARIDKVGDNDGDDNYDYEIAYANPPPITQVSKLLRQEALPLFFQTFKFDLHASWYSMAAKRGEEGLYFNSFEFLATITDENFALIRTLHLFVTAYLPYERREERGQTCLTLRVHVGAGIKATTCTIEENGVQRVWSCHRQNFEVPLTNLMTVISGRVGGKKLLKSDVKAIVSNFNAPCFKSEEAE